MATLEFKAMREYNILRQNVTKMNVINTFKEES